MSPRPLSVQLCPCPQVQDLGIPLANPNQGPPGAAAAAAAGNGDLGFTVDPRPIEVDARVLAPPMVRRASRSSPLRLLPPDLPRH